MIDVASDVETVFEEALDEGLNLQQTSQRTLEYFAQELEDTDDGPLIYLALAGERWVCVGIHPRYLVFR